MKPFFPNICTIIEQAALPTRAEFSSKSRILPFFGPRAESRAEAFRSWKKAEFRNVNFSHANLSNSDPPYVLDGADFTGATLDLPQQKALCARATGKTSESLQCGGLNQAYVPASKEQNKFNPGIN